MVKMRRTSPKMLPMTTTRRRMKTPITRRRRTTRTRRRTLTATMPMTMMMRKMKRRTSPPARESPPARKALRMLTMRERKREKEKTLRMLTMREKEKTLRMLTMRETKTEREREKTLRRMRMKMQKMTSVNGKTGVSGLVDAARSLADALEFKLEAGPLTTSCLTRAAADSSVQDGKLKLGPAKKKIVAKMPMMVRMRRTALMMRTRRMTPTLRTRRTTPTTRTRMTRRMVMKMQKMTNVNGKTGASGLVNAAHSLADVLAVKLVAGPLTTSCLIRAAADSSVPDVKLKLGPARNPIANQLNLQPANGETGASGLVDAGLYSAGSMAVRRARGGRPTTCRTDSAAAFSARGRKPNPGAAETPKLMFQNCDDFQVNIFDTTSFSNSNESKPMCILFKFSTFKINPPLFSQLSTSITNLRAEIPKKIFACQCTHKLIEYVEI